MFDPAGVLDKITSVYEEYTLNPRSVSTSKLRRAVVLAKKFSDYQIGVYSKDPEKTWDTAVIVSDLTDIPKGRLVKQIPAALRKGCLYISNALRDGSRSSLALALDDFSARIHAYIGILPEALVDEDDLRDDSSWEIFDDIGERLDSLAKGARSGMRSRLGTSEKEIVERISYR